VVQIPHDLPHRRLIADVSQSLRLVLKFAEGERGARWHGQLLTLEEALDHQLSSSRPLTPGIGFPQAPTERLRFADEHHQERDPPRGPPDEEHAQQNVADEA
jgi:hypothetical protein